jgi:DNA (cytosine-5)-methyltransferase 1
MSRINTEQFSFDFKSDKITSIFSDKEVTCGEFFAGGGGWTSGMAGVPGIKPLWILNHDKVALRTNAYHHKDVKVYWADLYVQDEHEMEYVDYIHGSIECDQHSKANSGKKKKIGSYTMGWEFYRFIKYLMPLVISIENVPEYKKWAPVDENGDPIKARSGEEFERWKKAMMDLGYLYKESIRNAADDGIPTRRVRYFAFFYKPGIEVDFPEYTHSATGKGGKQKWESCRKHLDLNDHGVSIFGRKFNKALAKHQRRPLVHNSLRRIAGGIRKQHPEFHKFLCKYHGGDNPERSYSIDDPIMTIDGSNRHQVITVENGEFIQDHCQTDNYQSVDDPLRTQMTWQTKQLINWEINQEKLQFIMDHCFSDKVEEVDDPLSPQTSQQTKRLISLETEDPFIVQHYGSSDSQCNSLDDPIYTIPCRDIHQIIRLEKMQFIVTYFNSGGNPGTNNQSLDGPLSTVMTVGKHQLVTLLDSFDIKARFLKQEELASCTTFPRDYFSHPELKLSEKVAIQLIGNAVPPEWARKIMHVNVNPILKYKLSKLSA